MTLAVVLKPNSDGAHLWTRQPSAKLTAMRGARSKKKSSACRASKNSSDTSSIKNMINDMKSLLTVDREAFNADELAKELADTQDFGKRGEVYVLGQGVLIFLVIFPLVELDVVAQLVGLAAIVGGGLIIVTGSTSLGKSLSPLPAPRQGSELVTDGMYAYMRHPLYTGLIMGSLGLSLTTGDQSRVMFAIALWVLLYYKSELEEEFLLKKYGDEYAQYKSRVKRFWLL